MVKLGVTTTIVNLGVTTTMVKLKLMLMVKLS